LCPSREIEAITKVVPAKYRYANSPDFQAHTFYPLFNKLNISKQ